MAKKPGKTKWHGMCRYTDCMSYVRGEKYDCELLKGEAVEGCPFYKTMQQNVEELEKLRATGRIDGEVAE